MGLYGAIIVTPSDPSYWPPADRELTITLDDLLIEDGQIAPFFGPVRTTRRWADSATSFSSTVKPTFSGKAAVGEVVRLHLINTANTRIFNVSVRGARMKLVGGDSGRYERETFVDDVLLSPSERAVVDVLFSDPGEARLEHRTPTASTTWDASWSPEHTQKGRVGRSTGSVRMLRPVRASIGRHVDREPDKVLSFVASMPLLYADEHPKMTTYVCLCTLSNRFGSVECAKCGMTLVPLPEVSSPTSYACPMHPEVTASEPGQCPKCRMKLVA